MALMVSKARKTEDVFKEVINSLETDPLFLEEVYKRWFKTVDMIGDVSRLFSSVNKNLRVAMKATGETVDTLFSKKAVTSWVGELASCQRRFVNIQDEDVNYQLFATTDAKAVFDPVPGKTVHLYDESFSFTVSNLKSVLGRCILKYLLDPSDKNKKSVRDEITKRVRRRVMAAYKSFLRNGISIETPDLFKACEEGKILESDCGVPQNAKDLLHLSLIRWEEYSHSDLDEATAARRIADEVILKSKNIRSAYVWRGNFVKAAYLIKDEILVRLINQFGFDQVEKELLLDENGKRKMPYLVWGTGLSGVIPDKEFRKYLVESIGILCSYSSQEFYDVSSLTHHEENVKDLLSDPRSDAILDDLGGLYSNFYRSSHHEKIGSIFVGNDSDFWSRWCSMAPYRSRYIQGVVYMCDKHYNQFKEFLDILKTPICNESPKSKQEFLEAQIKRFQQMRPYSELVNTKRGMPESTEFFRTRDYYCPGLRNEME